MERCATSTPGDFHARGKVLRKPPPLPSAPPPHTGADSEGLKNKQKKTEPHPASPLPPTNFSCPHPYRENDTPDGGEPRSPLMGLLLLREERQLLARVNGRHACCFFFLWQCVSVPSLTPPLLRRGGPYFSSDTSLVLLTTRRVNRTDDDDDDQRTTDDRRPQCKMRCFTPPSPVLFWLLQGRGGALSVCVVL